MLKPKSSGIKVEECQQMVFRGLSRLTKALNEEQGKGLWTKLDAMVRGYFEDSVGLPDSLGSLAVLLSHLEGAKELRLTVLTDALKTTLVEKEVNESSPSLLDFASELICSDAFDSDACLEVVCKLGLTKTDADDAALVLLKSFLSTADLAAFNPVRRQVCSLATSLAGMLTSEEDREWFKAETAQMEDPEWLADMLEAMCEGGKRETELTRRWLAGKELGERLVVAARRAELGDGGKEQRGEWELLRRAFEHGKS